MKIQTLSTGSKGNAYIVTSNGGTSILLEAGIPVNKMMQASDYTLSRCDACFITHEHGDHAKYAKQISPLIPTYATPGTVQAIRGKQTLLAPIRTISYGCKVKVDRFTVTAYQSEHDAEEPALFVIDDAKAKERLLFATDTASIPYDIPDMTHLLVECSYDNECIGATNSSLANRIESSHMELQTLLKWLKRQDLSKVQEINLCHLSTERIDPEKAKRAVQATTGKVVNICESKL